MTPTILLNEEDLLDRPMPPTLVDELFIMGTTCFLVSKPGVGKSFMALDLALSIAAGLPSFLGFPLRVQGPVVYVLAEGAGRFGLRIKAWKNHHNIIAPLPFFWTNGPANLMEGDDIAGFIEAIEGMEIPPALIVFDTFSRCVPGAEENGQAEMSIAISHLDAIKAAVPGMTVLVLHHLNAAGDRERGSTVINAAIDTQLNLKAVNDNGEERIMVSTSKQKDLDQRKAFKLVKTVVETDDVEENGTLATALVWSRLAHEELEPGEVEEAVMSLDLKIAHFIRENPNCTKQAVYAVIGGKKASVLDMIDVLVSNGVVKRIVKGQTHLLTLSSASSLSPASRHGEEGNYLDLPSEGTNGEPQNAQQNRIGNRLSALQTISSQGQIHKVAGTGGGNRVLTPLKIAPRRLFRARDARDGEGEE